MRVFSKAVLRRFWTLHPRAETPLRTWWSTVERARWSSPHDIRAMFPAVDFVTGNRAIFDIGGNKYRLVVEYDLIDGLVFIRFIGTHAEYDDIDARTI